MVGPTSGTPMAVRQIKAGNMSLRKASRTYNVPLGTLNNKVHKKHCGKPGHPVAFSEAEEEIFVEHLLRVAEWGFPFTTMDLRILAKSFLDKEGRNVAQFAGNFPSVEWAKSFLKRHHGKVSEKMARNIKKARARVSKEEVEGFFTNFRETVEKDDTPVPPENYYNYDETNVTDDPGQRRCIFKRGEKYPERVRDNSKTAISLMFCGCADGQMLPPYTVYKSEHLWSTWMEGGPQGARYNRSKSGWFDSTCFTDWFLTIVVPDARKKKGRKIVTGDNLSSHFTEPVIKAAEQLNIDFVCFPPNSTHLMQPLDVAFYRPLKGAWRSILDSWKAKQSKQTTTLSKDCFPGLLTKLCDKICKDSNTGECRSQNIIAGFRKCGLYPLDSKPVLSRLPDAGLDSSSLDESNADEKAILEKKSASVSDSVVEILKRMRGVDDENQEKKRKRRRKVDVEAGKSISYEDFLKSLGKTSSEQTVQPSTSTDINNNETVGPLLEGASDEEETDDKDDEEDSEGDSVGSSTGEVEQGSIDSKSLSTGDFVMVLYEGSAFPGTIVNVAEDGALVEVMVKCKCQGWKWNVEHPDRCFYLWEDIVKKISKPVPINKRGMFRVKELDEMWGQ